MNIRQVTGDIPTLIGMNEIDETPGPYCMSFGFDLKPLILSIEKFGPVNTPFVTKNSDGRVDVVVGYRRVLAMKSLKWEKVPCIDLSNSEFSPSECLLLNLHDNIVTRKFNDVEKGMILSRLISHLPRKKILEHYMPLLDLPSNASTLDILVRVEELDHQIRLSFAEGYLSIHTIKALLEMDPESRSLIFKWMSNIKFNLNQQKYFIEYTSDIAIKERKTIFELLDEKNFYGILEENRLNNPQKAKWILEALRSRRFPVLTTAEKTFQKRVSGLNLPEGVKIKHPPFFEAPDYRLEIQFKNGKELKEKISSLSQLKNDVEKIGDPWQEEF